MAARKVMAGTVLPIMNHIKANIAQALADVRAEYLGNEKGKVTTEVPVDYFIFDKAIGYRTPAVFVLGDDVDFRLDKGQNFISALCKVYVSVLVEDRDAELLMLKCWRYSDAMHEILDQAVIEVPADNIKNVIKVSKMEYSNTFQAKSSVEGPFRKEVMLTLDVEHYEKR